MPTILAMTSAGSVSIRESALFVTDAVGLPDSLREVCQSGVGNGMKPETAKLFADAIMKTLHHVGFSVDDFVSALIAAPVDGQLKDLMRQVVTNQFAHDVAQSPEPTPEELAMALAVLDRIRTSPKVLRERLRAIRKGLPRTPGGPKRRIPLKEESRVCVEVETLEARGYDRPTAVQSVASKRRASTRTVYRILERQGKTKSRKRRKTAVK